MFMGFPRQLQLYFQDESSYHILKSVYYTGLTFVFWWTLIYVYFFCGKRIF